MKTLKLGYRDGVHKAIHIEDTPQGTVLHATSTMQSAELQRILDSNHELRRDGVNKTPNGMRHLGRVPATVLLGWRQVYDRERKDRDFATFAHYVEAKLKEHDFSLLRITEG